MARRGDQLPGRRRRRPLVEPSDRHLNGNVTDDLLVAAGRGDLDAYAAFYDQTAPVIFGLLRGGLGECDGAERATERVYLRLWRTAARFDPTGRSAYALLLCTARRELIGRLRDLDAR